VNTGRSPWLRFGLNLDLAGTTVEGDRGRGQPATDLKITLRLPSEPVVVLSRRETSITQLSLYGDKFH